MPHNRKEEGWEDSSDAPNDLEQSVDESTRKYLFRKGKQKYNRKTVCLSDALC